MDNKLQSLWFQLWQQWFSHESSLGDYTVIWSRRQQKRTLATCQITNKKVIVARELSDPRYEVWLSPLLYHEMCHIVVGYKRSQDGTKTCWHHPEFRRLERQHPGIAELDAWIKAGGWMQAIRRDRAKRAWQKRKAQIIALFE